MFKVRRIFTWMIWMIVIPGTFACSGQNDRLKSDLGQDEEANQNAEQQAVISFDTLSHDFGTILEGEKVVCYFDYVNTGMAELVVNSVEVTCGCTIPDWSSEPLKPGDKKNLKIIFDSSGRSGIQRKVVTVTSNASNNVVKLTLMANIET